MVQREIDMRHGPIFQKIVAFGVPLILTGVLQLFYNAADIIVVGQFAGKEALAAVGSTSELIALIVHLFMGLSVGAGVVVSKGYGAGDRAAIGDAVHTSVAVAALSGFLLIFFGLFFSRPILTLMDSPADVIDGAALYLKIYFVGMPFNLVFNFGAAILRAVGDTRRPLYFLTAAGIVNVVLNLIFVIFLHMSVAGVALATIISQAVSAILVIRCLMHHDGTIRLSLKSLRIKRKVFWQIAKIGLPAGIQSALFSIANVLIQSTINTFGSDVIAGNSAAANLEGFVNCSMNAFTEAVMTFSSQNLGAKKYARMGKGLRTCVLCSFVVAFTLGNLVYLFRTPLLSLYNSDPNVIAMGSIRLFYFMPLYFLCGIMNVMAGHIRGMGYSVTPMLISLSGACFFRLGWLFTVFAAFPTLDVLYVSYPLTWALTVCAHLICYTVVRRRFPKEDASLPEPAETI